jgi:hypothetical protein
MRLTVLAILIFGMTMSSVGSAPAAEWVEFTTLVTKPTPFALKRAREQGVELEQDPGTPLRGLPGRPGGAGPFPAVALLHGCDGGLQLQERWAEVLTGCGYVNLLVDRHGRIRVQYLGHRFDPEEFRSDLLRLADEP